MYYNLAQGETRMRLRVQYYYHLEERRGRGSESSEFFLLRRNKGLRLDEDCLKESTVSAYGPPTHPLYWGY